MCAHNSLHSVYLIYQHIYKYICVCPPQINVRCSRWNRTCFCDDLVTIDERKDDAYGVYKRGGKIMLTTIYTYISFVIPRVHVIIYRVSESVQFERKLRTTIINVSQKNKTQLQLQIRRHILRLEMSLSHTYIYLCEGELYLIYMTKNFQLFRYLNYIKWCIVHHNAFVFLIYI